MYKIFDSIFRKLCFFYQNKILIKFNSINSEINSRIYMFHKITKDETNLYNFNSNVISFEKFILDNLKKFKPIKLENIFEYENNMFAITFDDVDISIYKNAIPILEKYSIPYTLFITIEYLDKENYLSKDIIKKISKSKLCTIGSHTLSHTMLRFDKNYKIEMQNSKIELEKILQCDVNLFAYPYGSIYSCSRKNIRYSKNCGYTYSFSAINGTLCKKTLKNKYFIPRLNGDLYVQELERNGKKCKNPQ